MTGIIDDKPAWWLPANLFTEEGKEWEYSE